MSVLDKIHELEESGIVTQLETEYVRYLLEINPAENDDVLWAAAACIHAQRNGHVCLDLNKVIDTYLFKDKKSGVLLTDEIVNNWLEKLAGSKLVSAGDTLCPMVLEGKRLYLQRLWKYEEELAEWLKTKSKASYKLVDAKCTIIQNILTPTRDLFEVDWQHVGVYLSFIKDLLIISGGPGTGKTHTVLSILASQLLANNESELRIAMAAPTGKAARRLTESIEQGKHRLPDKALEMLDSVDAAVTVHKLLGSDYGGNRFRYNESNKLPYDLVILDEASMLDINMWIRLKRATGDHTKLIILGDKDQLASVEAGSILGDVCQGENTFSESVVKTINNATGMAIPQSENKNTISDSILFLTKSYRFGEGSGIQKFSEAVNNFDVQEAIRILKDPKFEDISWFEIDDDIMQRVIKEYAINHFREYNQKPMDQQLSASNQMKILCSVRNGPMGVKRINQIAENNIRRHLGHGIRSEWYSGRIVMATQNNSILKVRNGEIGICIGETDSKIQFEGEQEREVTASRLNEYEPAYAITIHKSQGSEFDDIAIMLSGSTRTILSKEILYTSVTRARKNTLIVAKEETLKSAISHSVLRNSGLQEKIWGRRFD